MTAALGAIERIDDGTATVEDRLIADLFDAHASDAWHQRNLKADHRPADVCACGERKEPGEHECNGCFLDFDDQMRRAEDI